MYSVVADTYLKNGKLIASVQRRIELLNLPPNDPNDKELLWEFQAIEALGIGHAPLSSIQNCFF